MTKISNEEVLGDGIITGSYNKKKGKLDYTHTEGNGLLTPLVEGSVDGEKKIGRRRWKLLVDINCGVPHKDKKAQAWHRRE